MKRTGNIGGHYVVDGRRRHRRWTFYEKATDIQHSFAHTLGSFVELWVDFVELQIIQTISTPAISEFSENLTGRFLLQMYEFISFLMFQHVYTNNTTPRCRNIIFIHANEQCDCLLM
jgi:hypothetical protein